MNSINYKNRTLFAYKENKQFQQIDIRPLKKLLNIYYKDIPLKVIIQLSDGKISEYKQRNIRLRIGKGFLNKYYKLTFDTKKYYYNVYLPIKYNKPSIDLYHRINDIILYINVQMNTKMKRFNFEKEIGLTLGFRNFMCIRKKYKNNIREKSINFFDMINKFIKTQPEYKQYKKEKEEKKIRSHVIDIDEFKQYQESLLNSTIDSCVESIESTIDSVAESQSTINDLKSIDETVDEIYGLIKNIDITLQKYE